jgi:ATP-grasp domain
VISPQLTVAEGNGTFTGERGLPKILLTSTTKWPSSARLMIEFSRLGHVVSIVCPRPSHPSRKVRAAHRTFPYKPLVPISSVAYAIGAVKPDIVVPCDDLAVRHLHQLHASERAQHRSDVDIRALIARSLGPPESYGIVTSRHLLLKLAREERILTPETNVIENSGDLERWRSTQPLPWVLKADGTTGGAGVRIAHTEGAARICLSDLRRSMGLFRSVKHLIIDRDLVFERQWWNGLRAIRPAVVVQSFIRGIAANCAVVCWKGEVLAGIGCEAVITETPVGPATVIRLVESADMMVAAQRIARRLGISGFFGLDFVIEEGTGASYLIEMNPRCTPPSHLRLGIGRDMVGMLSAKLTGKPLIEPMSITRNNLIAYFPEAVLRNSEFLASSYHDVPEGEPELIEEFLQLSPHRKILSHVANSSRIQSVLNRRAQ